MPLWYRKMGKRAYIFLARTVIVPVLIRMEMVLRSCLNWRIKRLVSVRTWKRVLIVNWHSSIIIWMNTAGEEICWIVHLMKRISPNSWSIRLMEEVWNSIFSPRITNINGVFSLLPRIQTGIVITGRIKIRTLTARLRTWRLWPVRNMLIVLINSYLCHRIWLPVWSIVSIIWKTRWSGIIALRIRRCISRAHFCRMSGKISDGASWLAVVWINIIWWII